VEIKIGNVPTLPTLAELVESSAIRKGLAEANMVFNSYSGACRVGKCGECVNAGGGCTHSCHGCNDTVVMAEIVGKNAEFLTKLVRESGGTVAEVLAEAIHQLRETVAERELARFEDSADGIVAEVMPTLSDKLVVVNTGHDEPYIGKVVQVVWDRDRYNVNVVPEWSEMAWGTSYDDEDVEGYFAESVTPLTPEETYLYLNDFEGRPRQDDIEAMLLQKYS